MEVDRDFLTTLEWLVSPYDVVFTIVGLLLFFIALTVASNPLVLAVYFAAQFSAQVAELVHQRWGWLAGFLVWYLLVVAFGYAFLYIVREADKRVPVLPFGL